MSVMHQITVQNHCTANHTNLHLVLQTGLSGQRGYSDSSIIIQYRGREGKEEQFTEGEFITPDISLTFYNWSMF